MTSGQPSLRFNTMVVEVRDMLKVGLYTPPEAAFYARVRTGMMNRWMFGDKIGSPVFSPQFSDPDEKIVTFLDFIQVLAIRALRLPPHKVPLHKIRQAVDIAREQDIRYPFAMEHVTYIYGDSESTKRVGNAEKGRKYSSDIVLDIGGRLIQASGPIAAICLYARSLNFT